MGTTLGTGIKGVFDADATLVDLLPGKVWTRPIRQNKAAAGQPPTPGSTPEAFDGAGRIRRCASISSVPETQNPTGLPTAYWGFPDIYLRCLPHESEKAKVEQAIRRIQALLHDRVLAGPEGEGLILSLAGRIGPDDDPIIPNAVLYMVRVQVDSVWKV